MTSKATKAKKKALNGVSGADLIKQGLLDEHFHLADYQDMRELRDHRIKNGHMAFLKKHDL